MKLKEIMKDEDKLFDGNWFKREKWYEGDFKKKYPNGVLCRVWSEGYESDIKVIIDYIQNSPYPFISKRIYGIWQYAEPVKPKEAPAIIGGKDE